MDDEYDLLDDYYEDLDLLYEEQEAERLAADDEIWTNDDEAAFDRWEDDRRERLAEQGEY